MREKGQTEVAKTLETPVFSRGIEILTEKFILPHFARKIKLFFVPGRIRLLRGGERKRRRARRFSGGGVGPETSAANFGRDATHAQRVTGLPGFAKGEMGGASRTRAGFASGAPE